MESKGASSGAHIASGSSGATGWSGISFGVQQTSVAQFSGAANILKQGKQLMAKAEMEKLQEGKN